MRTEQRGLSPILVIGDDADGSSDVVQLLVDAGIAVKALPTAIGAARTIVADRIGVVVVVSANDDEATAANIVRLFKRQARLAHVRVILVADLDTEASEKLAELTGAYAAVSKHDLEHALLPHVTAARERKTANAEAMRRVIRERAVSGTVQRQLGGVVDAEDADEDEDEGKRKTAS